MVMYSSYYIVCKYMNPCKSLGVTTAMIEYYHIVPIPVTPRHMQSYEQILGTIIIMGIMKMKITTIAIISVI